MQEARWGKEAYSLMVYSYGKHVFGFKSPASFAIQLAVTSIYSMTVITAEKRANTITA